MANKDKGWKGLAEFFAFFSLAVIVIVGVFGAIGVTWTVFQIAKMIVYLFMVILIAVASDIIAKSRQK